MNLTSNEAASQLGVTLSRVHQFIYTKRLPAKKHGRDWVIDQKDLKLLRNRKNGAPFKKKGAK